ncbi:MAG: protein kinase, partial [Anaerolineae bacterium]|nr:protein kinase [Anaerolineae bacterium]
MDSDPLISRVIGNYRIEARLGRGGMSTVYRARQLTMQRDVAIKVMSAELATEPQFISRFEREAQVIANLEHPRILPVHDYGHEGEFFFLVMRMVDGESLRDRLLSGALSLATAAHLIEQIASALDYAHGRGVIHRDLKPNNVLIDKLDNAYLMDFGIAKLMAASQQLTATGMVMGTPAYMAPEQWRGEPVDVRTDVYSLGVMLYEMVLGCQPFEAADTPFTLMYKHLNDPPPAPRTLLPDLPEAVERVILKALAKDPAERYPSAGALAAAFSEAIKEAGTAAHITPPPRSEPCAEPDADALVPVPLPDKIAPPPAPIPVPGTPAPPLVAWPDDESQPEVYGKRKRKRKAKPSPAADLP